jgi:predicted dehydrogenase
MAQDSPIKVAIVGTGGIAHAQARSLKAIPGVELTAACDIFPGKAKAFAAEFDIPCAYEDLDTLLAGEDVDVVTVVTPDASHAETSFKVIAHGKHIMCEKPLATFVAGDLQTINCQLKTFPKIDGDRLGEYGMDANDSAVISVTFTGGSLGTIHTSRWATGHANSLRLRVFGEKASLVVDLDQSYTSLKICQGEDVDKVKWKTLRCGKTPNNFERFIHSIRTCVNDQPDFARGAQVQKWLDASFASDKAGATQVV